LRAGGIECDATRGALVPTRVLLAEQDHEQRPGEQQSPGTHDDGPGRVERRTHAAGELYDAMFALYPHRANPGALWASAKQAKS
jgi:hypothetical protein